MTAGSFDAYMWQTLEIKQKFIQQLLRGEIAERSLADLGAGSAFTPAEVKAHASGRPEIMEVVRLDSEIGRLTALRVHHDENQRKLYFDLQTSDRTRVRLAGEIEAIGTDAARVRDAWQAAGEHSPGFTIGGTRYAGEGYRKPAAAALGQALHEIVRTARRTRDDQLVHSVGSYLGLDIRAGVVCYRGEMAPVFRPVVWLRGEHQYDRVQPDLEQEQPEAILASLERRAHPRHLEHELAERQRAHDAAVQRIADLRREVGQPFASADLLREITARRDAIVEGLKLDERTPGEVLVEAPAEAPANDLPPPDVLVAALERGDAHDLDHAR